MSREIIDYMIIDTTWHKELEIKVNQKIHEGWQPYGTPIGVNTGDCGVSYAQAMVIYSEEENQK